MDLFPGISEGIETAFRAAPRSTNDETATTATVDCDFPESKLNGDFRRSLNVSKPLLGSVTAVVVVVTSEVVVIVLVVSEVVMVSLVVLDG